MQEEGFCDMFGNHECTSVAASVGLHLSKNLVSQHLLHVIVEYTKPVCFTVDPDYKVYLKYSRYSMNVPCTHDSNFYDVT